MKKLVISVLLVNLLVACASDKAKDTSAASAASSEASTAASAAASAAASTSTTSKDNVAADPLNDPNSLLAKRSVYFAYDMSAVQDADKPVVMAHGKYMGDRTDRKVRVEGNADERGSNEYIWLWDNVVLMA